jgi:hypothetical protein
VGLDRVDGQDQPATAIASFIDDGQRADGVGRRLMPGSTPPDCGEDLQLFGQIVSIVLTDN